MINKQNFIEKSNDKIVYHIKPTQIEITKRMYKIMTSNNSSRMEVPQAKEAMDKFKMEVASEIGVPLKNGYNGDLTSAQNGSVGGEMVRQMIRRQEEEMLGK